MGLNDRDRRRAAPALALCAALVAVGATGAQAAEFDCAWTALPEDAQAQMIAAITDGGDARQAVTALGPARIGAIARDCGVATTELGRLEAYWQARAGVEAHGARMATFGLDRARLDELLAFAAPPEVAREIADEALRGSFERMNATSNKATNGLRGEVGRALSPVERAAAVQYAVYRILVDGIER